MCHTVYFLVLASSRLQNFFQLKGRTRQNFVPLDYMPETCNTFKNIIVKAVQTLERPGVLPSSRDIGKRRLLAFGSVFKPSPKKVGKRHAMKLRQPGPGDSRPRKRQR